MVGRAETAFTEWEIWRQPSWYHSNMPFLEGDTITLQIKHNSKTCRTGKTPKRWILNYKSTITQFPGCKIRKCLQSAEKSVQQPRLVQQLLDESLVAGLTGAEIEPRITRQSNRSPELIKLTALYCIFVFWWCFLRCTVHNPVIRHRFPSPGSDSVSGSVADYLGLLMEGQQLSFCTLVRLWRWQDGANEPCRSDLL